MPWVKAKLRGKDLYLFTDESGAVAVDGGRAFAVYKLTPSAKVYRPNLRNVDADPEAELEDGGPTDPTSAADDGAAAKTATKKRELNPAEVPTGAITVYTDGACIGNPGPMGLGAVIIDGDERNEISEYLGTGTNNIAELTAILRALESLGPEQRKRPVYVHSDSSYALGLLSKGWKAKANKELVAELRQVAGAFDDLHYVKVKGHAGIPENERCDELAGDAIRNRTSSP